MAGSKVSIADRLKGPQFERNIWWEYAEFLSIPDVVNLGMGCPDYPPPEHVVGSLRALTEVDDYRLHQYTGQKGHPRLMAAVAKLYGRFHNRRLDPKKEILISSGAILGLSCSFQGLINPGDEVIVIEPFFDRYLPIIAGCGGKTVYVPLRPPADKSDEMTSADWTLDPEELASKFNSKTKLIVLNNPNNPTGKVFKRDELQLIADLCIQHDVVCVADEVYEWMTFPGTEHIRIANLPNMWDRTISISSAGKTFSATGWRLGWSIGPEHLLKCVAAAHNALYTMVCTPVQVAVAELLEIEERKLANQEQSYLHTMASELLPKRDRMSSLLKDVGITPTIPEAGYFVLSDWSKLGVTDELIEDNSNDSRDIKFFRWLAKKRKLIVIPLSAFYGDEHKHLAQGLMRVCFVKQDQTITNAGEVLKLF